MIQSFPSLMDPNLRVTEDNWAVTLTCDKQKFSFAPPAFHARLVFEGVNEETKEFFYRIAHLRGPSETNPFAPGGCSFGKSQVGKVEISEKREREEFKPNFRTKTETWVLTRHKIEGLINEIKQEQEKEIPFQICGNKSLFAKQAEIFEIYDEVLGEIKKQDTLLFLRLYDSARNGGECTGMSREAFDQAISKALVAIKQYRPIGNYGYDTLIYMVRIYSEKLNQSQHNCFTWAREKLGTIGIKLPDNQLERIISITSLYATYKPNEKISECNSCIISEREAEGVNKWEGKKLYERFVTYDLDRDCRTEEWKLIEKRNNNNHLIGSVLYFTGRTAEKIGIVSLLTLPFVMAAPVLLGAAVSAFFTGVTACTIVDLKSEEIKKNQSELLQFVNSNSHLKQPGNNLSRISKLSPTIGEVMAEESRISQEEDRKKQEQWIADGSRVSEEGYRIYREKRCDYSY